MGSGSDTVSVEIRNSAPGSVYNSSNTCTACTPFSAEHVNLMFIATNLNAASVLSFQFTPQWRNDGATVNHEQSSFVRARSAVLRFNYTNRVWECSATPGAATTIAANNYSQTTSAGLAKASATNLGIFSIASVTADVSGTSTAQTNPCRTITLIGSSNNAGIVGGTWSQISGPSTVTIWSNTSTVTKASGALSDGTYTFRWTRGNSSCGANLHFADVAIVVTKQILPTPTTSTWSGEMNSDWNTCENWSGGLVPASTTSIVISNAATNYPVMDGSTTYAGLSIESGASMDMTSNLELTGDLVIATSAQLNILGSSRLTCNGNLTINGSAAFSSNAALKIGGTNTIISGAGGLTVSILLVSKNSKNNTFTLNKTLIVSASLVLQKGMVVSSDLYPLTVSSSGDIIGGNDTSFIKGPLYRQTNTVATFNFPVGNAGCNAALLTTSSATLTTWRVNYNNGTPLNNTQFSSAQGSENLYQISNVGYWDIDRISGTSNAMIRLPFKNNQMITPSIFNRQIVRVAHYNGSTWESTGSDITLDGNENDGTITSPLVASFSPFTIGTLDPNILLPVTWLSIVAKSQNNRDVVSWSTTDETGNSHFIVLNSYDGIHFKTVCERVLAKPGVGIRQYQVSLPANGGYYKIRQVDFDGHYSDSPIAFIETVGIINTIQVYPNPAYNSLYLSGLEAGNQLVIRNVSGFKVAECYTQPDLKLDISQLAPGVYIIEGGNKTIRFVKAH